MIDTSLTLNIFFLALALAALTVSGRLACRCHWTVLWRRNTRITSESRRTAPSRMRGFAVLEPPWAERAVLAALGTSATSLGPYDKFTRGSA